MRVVVTGSSGKLGSCVVPALQRRGHEVIPWRGHTSSEVAQSNELAIDLARLEEVRIALEQSRPDVVVHLAAISSAEDVRTNRERATTVNLDATWWIGSWCAMRGVRLVFSSTDMVFDGRLGWYSESDPTSPILAYGETKRDAELALQELPGVLIARLALLYGPHRSNRQGFFDQALRDLRQGKHRAFFVDEYRTPLAYGTAAEILAELVVLNAEGIVHVAGAERISRWELMRRVAAVHGIEEHLVLEDRLEHWRGEEARPADVALRTTRLDTLLPGYPRPRIEESLSRFW